jgi:hypothetical protein
MLFSCFSLALLLLYSVRILYANNILCLRCSCFTHALLVLYSCFTQTLCIPPGLLRGARYYPLTRASGVLLRVKYVVHICYCTHADTHVTHALLLRGARGV